MKSKYILYWDFVNFIQFHYQNTIRDTGIGYSLKENKVDMMTFLCQCNLKIYAQNCIHHRR